LRDRGTPGWQISDKYYAHFRRAWKGGVPRSYLAAQELELAQLDRRRDAARCPQLEQKPTLRGSRE